MTYNFMTKFYQWLTWYGSTGNQGSIPEREPEKRLHIQRSQQARKLPTRDVLTQGNDAGLVRDPEIGMSKALKEG